MKAEVFKAEIDPSIEALSTEELQKFQGGILEIINQVEGYIFRGEILNLRLVIEATKLSDGNIADDIALVLEFAWVKKASYNCVPTSDWEDEDRCDYESTLLCAVAQSLDGPPGKPDRLMITSPVTNEMLVFFPPREEQ